MTRVIHSVKEVFLLECIQRSRVENGGLECGQAGP